jgi:hypothetical protein
MDVNKQGMAWGLALKVALHGRYCYILTRNLFLILSDSALPYKEEYQFLAARAFNYEPHHFLPKFQELISICQPYSA